MQQLQRDPERPIEAYIQAARREYLRRAPGAQANGSESEAGSVWRMIFIGFVSIAAILADFILLSGNMVTDIPATLFFSALLAIGVGGIASLFGGAALVTLKKWGIFTGVSLL